MKMQNADVFMPTLFRVLFGFIILNMAINFILLLVKNRRINKLLAIFWPLVLFVFVVQSIFQVGDLPVAMAFSATLLPVSVFAFIGFEAIGRKFPWKLYLPFFAIAFPLTYLLHHLGYSFTTVAMPFAMATAAPLTHVFINFIFVERRTTTRLQKFLGVVALLQAIHCINFALFRMDPGSQLWGWLVAYAVYDMLAVILPSIALEEANLSENERLKCLVEEKTLELNRSLNANEGLLKILIHDVGNPLMIMRFYLAKLTGANEQEQKFISKIQKSQDVIDSLLTEVKGLYRLKHVDKMKLASVSIDECFKELLFIFADHLERKQIKFKFSNLLDQNVQVLADRTTLTHSVLGNLLSNAIKFSSPLTQIEITAREESGRIVLVVKDEGPGISKETIDNILLKSDLLSLNGTLGERGSGFGLSIVKSMVDAYGGQIEFQSQFTHPEINGTKIIITLAKA